jgi:hypothetical protein
MFKLEKPSAKVGRQISLQEIDIYARNKYSEQAPKVKL